MKTLREELAEYCGSLIDADIEAALAAAEKEPIVPSKRFEKRMAALIGTDKKASSARIKRIVIIAAAALLVLALAACAVPKVRESVAGFFVKVFGDHVEYTEPDITKERIEEEYGLVPIPEGFELSKVESNDSGMVTLYSDKNNTHIVLIQGTKNSVAQSIDNELGEIYEYRVGDTTVLVRYGEQNAQASWIRDGYYFSLIYDFPVEITVFEQWIASVDLV